MVVLTGCRTGRGGGGGVSGGFPLYVRCFTVYQAFTSFPRRSIVDGSLVKGKDSRTTHPFLTTECSVVQSSISILEQYIGLWPNAMIHGLLALFSGLLASLRSFVNQSS